jgi:DNA polymerase III subunit gamma/tau
VIDETSEVVPHQAIYRRWRAQTFAQMVGQEAVVETLRNAVRTNRVAHAVLFVGPRGTGKTSLARILAKAINCTNLQDGDPCDACPSCVAIREGRAMDLIEIDAASNRGIDAIRDLRERINYAPTDLKRKVYILDEAHQITKDAWNALLKSLEEPPDFVAFMFASTHPQEFPPAILSRLQRFDVRRLTTTEIEGKLRRILEADGREATPEAIHLIARLAAGGMRDAESMLDQLLSSSTGGLDEARVRALLGLANAETIVAFIDALVSGDVVGGIRLLDALDERGQDLRGFLDQVVDATRTAIIGAATEPGVARHAVSDLAGAARRLASIDPSRAGVGGLRLQLELILFPEPGAPRRPVERVAPADLEVPAKREVPENRGAAVIDRAAATPPPTLATQMATPAGPRTRPPAAPAPRAPAAVTPPAPQATPSGPTEASTTRPNTAAPEAGEPVALEPAQAKPALGTRATPRADPPRSESPEATLQPPAVDDELAVLRDRWPEIVTRISAHPPTRPLIVACRPVSVEGGVVTLGFPEDKAFLQAVAERRRSVLEEGIGAVLGRPIVVRCVATNLDLVPEIADDEAEFVLAEARRIFGDDVSDAAEVG